MVNWTNYVLCILSWACIGGCIGLGFRKARSSQNFTRVTKLLLAFTVLELTLQPGGLKYEFSPLLSTFHLLASLCTLSALIAFACAATWTTPMIESVNPKIRRLAMSGLGALFIQSLLGAWIRNTQSGLACSQFPLCRESFFPIPVSIPTVLAFAHRWWGVLLLGLFFHLALVAAKTTPKLAGPTRRALGLSVAQVILGIGTIMSGLSAESRSVHSIIGSLLWAILFYVAIRAGGFRWVGSPSHSQS